MARVPLTRSPNHLLSAGQFCDTLQAFFGDFARDAREAPDEFPGRLTLDMWLEDVRAWAMLSGRLSLHPRDRKGTGRDTGPGPDTAHKH